MSSPEPLESEVLHSVKNKLALIISLTDLAMLEQPTGDLLADLSAIRQAGREALELLPKLTTARTT